MATTDHQAEEALTTKPSGELLRWVIVLSATFFLVTIALNLWNWAGPPSWHPRIEANALELDFGERPVSDTVKHDLVLKNTGRKELLITDVVADCNCVTAKVAETRIPPGYSLTLPVRITLKREKNGELTRRLMVASNDSVNPELVLTMKGRVFGQQDAAK